MAELTSVPAIVVKLPAVLASLFPGCTQRAELPGSLSTVGDVVEELDRRWPGLRDRICDSRPAVRRHINIFVEGERAALNTSVRPGTEVHVLTAISGGS